MPALVHRRLRAPEEDGAALIDPPLAQAPAIIDENRRKARHWDEISGAPLSEWRRVARRDLIDLCHAQSRPGWPLGGTTFNQTPASPSDQPLVMSGHQPELFHPGVWLKNYLLDAIGQRVAGAAINLIIDNDIVSAPGITMPSGPRNDPRLVHVPIDVQQPAAPWSVRTVHDRSLFTSFGQRVEQAYSFWRSGGESLLIDEVWREAIRIEETEIESLGWVGSRMMSLAQCLAGARHRVELRIGLKTFEAPLSLLLGPAFRGFADHLLRSAGELRRIYNAALAEYRVVNRIRSRSHPVPALEKDGEWMEVPFWIWTLNNFRRRRAFVRQTPSGYELTDREGLVLQPGWNSWDGPHRDLAPALAPRALITTMYARLILSDLFIHGIGGARYDELTDLIIRRFFGFEPPAYITATATFRLPIARPNVSMSDLRQSLGQLREARYRPEAFLSDPAVRQDQELSKKLAALSAEKREYLDKHDLRRCSQHVFDQLDRLNRAMHDLLRPVEEELRARHAELVALAKQSQLLGSREFSFVLFPAETLPARLLDLSRGSS